MLWNTAKYTFASLKQQPVYIVAAKRTPIGSFLGKLSTKKATELGSLAVKGAMDSIKLDPKKVDEVILGNVCSAGLGQSPARQVSLGAGIPIDKPCINVNKVCASGLKTIVFGAQSIWLGDHNCVVAGGFESMSNIPHYILGFRKGQGYGDSKIIDGISFDGLTDVYNKIAMGLCAEKTATDFKITRQLQDDFCITSYERALNSFKQNKLQSEIVPVKISDKETVVQDEEPQKFKREKIPLLRPAFSKNTGTITAANSSKINDGACAIILMSEKAVKETGVKPLGRIVDYADAEVDPIDFCIAPAKSHQLALKKAGMKITQIDFHEFNEAFSVTVLANLKLLDLDIAKTNVNGGAVAMGHPIGMSGARIVQSVLNVLKERKGKYGMAGICNGGGGATSIIVENLQ